MPNKAFRGVWCSDRSDTLGVLKLQEEGPPPLCSAHENEAFRKNGASLWTANRAGETLPSDDEGPLWAAAAGAGFRVVLAVGDMRLCGHREQKERRTDASYRARLTPSEAKEGRRKGCDWP